MPFMAINELDCFQFHDAEIKKMKLINEEMTWLVSNINAMTTNTQNDKPKDMCIQEATMIFKNVSIEKLVFPAQKTYNSNQELIQSVNSVVASADEYADILKESTNRYCFITAMYNLPKIKNGKYRACFSIDGGAGTFYLTFTFSISKVEWNDYSGEAWYEHPKWKNQ